MMFVSSLSGLDCGEHILVIKSSLLEDWWGLKGCELGRIFEFLVTYLSEVLMILVSG